MNRLAQQLAFVTIVAASGCKQTEPNYCEDVPVTHNCLDKVDADTSCSSNAQCSGATPVCDLSGSKMCVQCTAEDKSACSGNTPVCGANNTCERCTMHAQCSSDVCLPDGSCSDGANVAYVDPNGTDNTTCTKTMPCTVVAKALATDRSYVKLRGTIDEQVTIDNQDVTLLAAPGAKLTSTTNGIVLEVKGTSKVTIHDLTIDGASGPSGYGISMPAGNTATLSLVRATLTNNTAGGISATGGTLNVTQSTISGNTGGGISVTGTGATFDITNSFIYRNGDPDNGTFGGVNLGIATASSSRFEFNTVVDNRASAGTTRVGGVLCDIVGFAAANNIIARNSVGGSTTGTNSQTLGACTYPTSKIQTDVSGLGFASPDMAPYSYKLTSGSSAIDQATTSSPIAVDYDGDERPQGPQKDIGADELK